MESGLIPVNSACPIASASIFAHEPESIVLNVEAVERLDLFTKIELIGTLFPVTASFITKDRAEVEAIGEEVPADLEAVPHPYINNPS